jgi:hypothetical protein
MGTTVETTVNATFQLVYAAYMQYMQNCQAFSSSLNYISFNGCNVTFDEINLRSQITLQQDCIMAPELSPSYAQFQTNLTQIAIDMANELSKSFDEAANSLDCPDSQSWNLGVTTYKYDDISCSVTATLNLTMDYVLAVAETMQQTCISSFLQQNIVVCGDPQPQTWNSVNYSKAAEQTLSCVSASANVKAKAQALIDYVTANTPTEKLESLRVNEQELAIAIGIVALWFVILLVLGIVSGMREGHRYFGVYVALIVGALAVWLLLGFNMSWYPYGDATTSPDVMRSNQTLFLSSVLVVGFLSSVSLMFSTAQIDMHARKVVSGDMWSWLATGNEFRVAE